MEPVDFNCHVTSQNNNNITLFVAAVIAKTYLDAKDTNMSLEAV